MLPAGSVLTPSALLLEGPHNPHLCREEEWGGQTLQRVTEIPMVRAAVGAKRIAKVLQRFSVCFPCPLDGDRDGVALLMSGGGCGAAPQAQGAAVMWSAWVKPPFPPIVVNPCMCHRC